MTGTVITTENAPAPADPDTGEAVGPTVAEDLGGGRLGAGRPI
ncbi:hypothetical protein [Streptomyces sp. NPDC005009]